jgi:hypothetical protein
MKRKNSWKPEKASIEYSKNNLKSKTMDLKKVSEMTGIPEWKFKKALGIKLDGCDATNIEDALKVFYSAKSGSEEETAARQVLDDLLKKKVKEAPTLKEARDLYPHCPQGGQAEDAVLLRIFYDLSLQERHETEEEELRD